MSASDHAKAKEYEALQTELQRRSALLNKKEADHAALSKKYEAVEQRLKELVRSEGEAEYKSRALAAKLASTERALDEATQQKRGVERTLSKTHQDTEKLRFELQALNQKLHTLQQASKNRHQSADQAEHKIRDLESKLSRSTSKIELYRGKIESLQRQLSDKDTESLLTQQKLELMMREHERLKKDLDENRLAVKSQRESKSELEDSVIQVKRKLSDAEDALERQKAQLEQVDANREVALQEMDQLKSELEASQASRQEQEEQVEELLEQLQAVEQYHAEEQEAVAKELQILQQKEQEWLEKERALQDASAEDSAGYQELLAEKSRLEDSEASFREEVEKQRKDLEDKKKQVIELTRWAERVRPAYETLKQKFSDLQTEYRKLHANYSEATNRSRQQTRLIETLQGREKETEGEVSLYAEQIEELQQELEFAQAETEQKSRALAELESRTAELNEELARSKESLENTRVDGEQTESELHELTELLEEVTQEKLGLEQRQAQLETDLEERKRHSDQLESQLNESKKHSSKLNTELNQQQNQTDKAQGNLKELLRQRSQLLDAKKLLEDALADAQRKEKQLREEVDRLTQDRDNATQALDELQTEFEGVNLNWINRIKELENEVHEANDSLQAARAEHDELKSQSEAERESFEGQLAELRSKSDLERDSFEGQLEELRAELLHSQETNAELEGQVGELTEVLDETQERLTDVESDLAERTSHNQELEQEVASLQIETEGLNQQLTETGERLDNTQAELEHHQKLLRKKAEERKQIVGNLEAAAKQNKALRELVARSQKESLGLRDYIEKLQALSKERLEQAKQALEKRDHQLKKQIKAVQDAQEKIYRVERRLERAKLSESALKGALTDLRVQLMEKDEMVEELEWHLGLVYQTLEDGQVDLEGKETELAGLTTDLEEVEHKLDSSRQSVAELESRLEQESKAHHELQAQFGALESQKTKLEELIDEQDRDLEDAKFHLTRTTARLERVLVDLTDEQERSARLGSQLTDALEDRNRRVQRLRELQREFSEWRGHRSGVADDSRQSEIDELSEELSLSQDRELEATRALEELRLELSKLREERAEEEAESESVEISDPPETEIEAEAEPEELAAVPELKESPPFLKASESDDETTIIRVPGDLIQQAAEPEPDPAAEAERLEALVAEVTSGVELGSQVLAAQMDLLEAQERHGELTDKMNKVETKEALTELLEDLRACDEERQHQAELLEALEYEWEQFRAEISEQALTLMDSVIELIDSEMKQSRAAGARVAALQAQLDGEIVVDPDEVKNLKDQLEERNTLAEELEEELASVSSQLAEVSDQLAQMESGAEGVSWKETSALRGELREKTELLERYRQERMVGPSRQESLEEELQNLNTRYKKGRERIIELLNELEERDRLLREVSQELPEKVEVQEVEEVPDTLTLGAEIDDDDVSPLLSEEEFELPMPPLEDIEELPELPEAEELPELPEADFSLPEDTVEDLPAIPYVEPDSLEGDVSSEEGSSDSF